MSKIGVLFYRLRISLKLIGKLFTFKNKINFPFSKIKFLINLSKTNHNKTCPHPTKKIKPNLGYNSKTH